MGLEGGSVDGYLLEDATFTSRGELSNVCNSRHFEEKKKG